MAQGSGPSQEPPHDEMLDASDSDTEEDPNIRELRNLRRQAHTQAQQMAEMMSMINQLTNQLMATPNERPATTKKPKIAPPEKYGGDREKLRTFLTHTHLYCEYNEIPNDQEKILMASTYMKDKASTWMQPYVDDYLLDVTHRGVKAETQALFASWTGFKQEMGRIFGEVDAKNQAEKKITRLRQTSSVSAYTAEFKQLQARIDWDDAALRTVFEAGLKENVKDGLVHHDKPETLHALVELATRIDNRLWERNDQKKYFRSNVANTRRQRGRYDNDGDAIMTGKVQDKTKGRKPGRKFDDGLSKEERQKRYDNKACLRCGKEGHFRRDCPENDKGRQGAVKIGMIRQGTPYPREQSTDSDVSDMELYEEARLLDNATYELLPRAVEAKDMTSWDEVQPTDLKVHVATVRQRLQDQQCWKCGWDTQLANECSQRGRIAITGQGAEETIKEAFDKQPYFEEVVTEEDEEPSEPEKEPQQTHGKNRAWEDASKDRPVKDEWYTKNVPTGQGPIPHDLLHRTFCQREGCHIHESGKEEAHQELLWKHCRYGCPFHRQQMEDARRVDDPHHGTLSSKICEAADCPIHEAKKQAPKPRSQRPESIPHQNIHWSFCHDDKCAIHYDAKYGAGHFPKKRKGKQSKN